MLGKFGESLKAESFDTAYFEKIKYCHCYITKQLILIL
jgi:hypothetical protein